MPVDLREPVPRLAGRGDHDRRPAPAPRAAPPRPRAAAPSPRAALSAPALVVHTSGTTGTPRPIVLTLGQILHNALGCAVALGHDRAERWLCPLPLSHVGGLMVLLRSAIYGTTAVLGPADRDDVTIASLVPTQLGRLLDREPPASLRVVMLGGAPADPTLLTRARDAGWPVAPTYGLTQACSAVTVAEVGDTETSGTPLPGIDVTIAADGEIVVDGPTVAERLHTGDLGELDDRGRLRVLGRKVDTIVSGGENVMPSEVEAALLAHPAVAEAGVFGRPDPRVGRGRHRPRRPARAARRRPSCASSPPPPRALQGPQDDRAGLRPTPQRGREAAAPRARARTFAGRKSTSSSVNRRTMYPAARSAASRIRSSTFVRARRCPGAVDLDAQSGPVARRPRSR